VTVELLGLHCIFNTSNTDIGTFTGSANAGANATLDIEATIPRTGGRSGAFCGSSAQWKGSYKVTSPKPLAVDRVCFQTGSGEGDYTNEMDCNTKEHKEPNLGEWVRRF
jgi:hypothetical protein